MRRCLFILTTAQIQMLEDCSERTAQRKMSDIRRYFNKYAPKSMTVEEYAVYNKVPVEDVRAALKRGYNI